MESLGGDTQIDQEWSKFMTKINKQNDCDIGGDDDDDDDCGEVEGDIKSDFDISNRSFAPPVGYIMHNHNGNIAQQSSNTNISRPYEAGMPTVKSVTSIVSSSVGINTAIKRAAKPPKRTCISKKQQRKTYSFVDTLENTNSIYSLDAVNAYNGLSDNVNVNSGSIVPDIIIERKYEEKQSHVNETRVDNSATSMHDNENGSASVCPNDNIESTTELDATNLSYVPKSSAIYISTKTKIAYLNKKVDIYNAFWEVPIIHYYTRKEGVIKKQIKFQTTNPADVVNINDKLNQQSRYFDQQIIEHIDNPNGRIVFKDQRKVSIGICKKDLLNNNSKKKRAFFNCFVLILRINGGICTDKTVISPADDILFKEMHCKVFNTGKLEIPGIQDDRTLIKVLDLLVSILRSVLGEDLNYLKDRCETVLINSNFNCGFYINRDKLFHLMKYKYRINSNYDSCSYPGIQCKFYYIPGETNQTGQQPMHLDDQKYYEISFMIFRTGSILIVGKCNESILMYIYHFIKHILEIEFNIIQMGVVVNNEPVCISESPAKIKDNDDNTKIVSGNNSSISLGLDTCNEIESTNHGLIASNDCLTPYVKKPKISSKTRRKIIMIGNINPFIPLNE